MIVYWLSRGNGRRDGERGALGTVGMVRGRERGSVHIDWFSNEVELLVFTF